MTPHELLPNLLSFQIIAAIAAFIAVLGIIFAFLIFYIRWKQHYKRRRMRELEKNWKGRFNEVLEGKEIAFPNYGNEEEIEVMVDVWNELYSSTDEEGRNRLITAAREGNMPGLAKQMMKEDTIHQKILGITTIGRLHHTEEISEIQNFVDSQNPLVALSAVRALVELGVDPESWIKKIPEPNNWPMAQVRQILKEADKDEITKPLISLVESRPEEDKPGYIHLLAEVNPEKGRPVLKEMLNAFDNPEIQAACLEALRSFEHPEDRNVARIFAKNDVPFLRLRAIRLLGRIGIEDKDVDLLRELLGDSNWWVRYRTAEALVHSDVVTEQELEQMKNEHKDQYARDILEQELSHLQNAG